MKKILIIEDEKDLTELLVFNLEKERVQDRNGGTTVSTGLRWRGVTRRTWSCST